MRALNLVLAAGGMLLCAVGAQTAVAKPAPSQGPVVLEKFFVGPLRARGSVVNTIDGSTRGIEVRMHGSWNGKTLTLVEDFVYSDGERDRKTWRFTKVAPGRYSGTREDVIGTADVVQDGDTLRLSYTARVATRGGSSYNIGFRDTLVKTGPRSVLNTADLSFLSFIPVGKVALTIEQVGRR